MEGRWVYINYYYVVVVSFIYILGGLLKLPRSEAEWDLQCD
jgi:hypothetical protein